MRRWEDRVGSFQAGRHPLTWFLALDRWEQSADRRFYADLSGRVTELRVRASGITSTDELTGLGALKALRRLDLSGNQFDRLDVAPHPALESLLVGGNPLRGLTGLSEVRGLRELDLSGTRLEGRLDVGALVSLRRLSVAGAPLREFVGLHRLDSLRVLDLSDSSVESVQRLADLGGLRPEQERDSPAPFVGFFVGRLIPDDDYWRIVDLSRGRIRDLSFLKGSSSPLVLRLDGLDFAELRGIEEVVSLRSLSVAGCRNVDVARLGGLRQLRSLNISHSQMAGSRVDAWQSLERMTALKTLDVTGSALASDSGGLPARGGLTVIGGRPTGETAPRLASPQGVVSEGDGKGLIVVLPVMAGVHVAAVAALGPVLSRRFVRRTLFRSVLGMTWVLASAALARWVGATSMSSVILWSIVLWVGVIPALLLASEVGRPFRGRGRVWLGCAADGLTAGSVLGAMYATSAGLSPVAGELLLLILLPIFSLSVVFFCLLPAVNWELHRALATKALAGEPSSRAVVVCPLRQLGPTEITALGWVPLRPRWGDAPGATIGRTYTCGPAMLAHLSSTGKAGAILLVAHRADAKEAQPVDWPVVEAWLGTLHRTSRVPIWLVGDWVGAASVETVPQAAALMRLAPLVQGAALYTAPPAEHLQLSAVPFVEKVIDANAFALPAHLDAHVERVLSRSFLSVASLLRRVFGEEHLANRLDLLTRATETAIAFFALACVAQYRGLRHTVAESLRRKLDAACEKNLGLPTFTSWVALVRSFRSAEAVPLGPAVAHAFRGAVGFDIAALRAVLTDVGGGAAIAHLPKEDTVESAIALLGVGRNLTVAHGPLAEAVDATVYEPTLCAAAAALGALPWDAAWLEVSAGSETAVPYVGCPPLDLGPDSPLRVCGLIIDVGGRRRYDPAPFFRPLGTQDVGLFAGAGRFVDPLSGVQVGAGSEADGD